MAKCKTICQRCHESQKWGWGVRDELRWNNGYVVCVHKKDMVKTDEQTKECPFELEHVVNENVQETIKEKHEKKKRVCK